MHPSRCLGTPSNCVRVVWDFGIPYHVMTGVRPVNHIQLPLLARVCSTIEMDVNRKYFPPQKDLYLHSRYGKRYSLWALCLLLEVGFVYAWQGQVLARYLNIDVVSKPFLFCVCMILMTCSTAFYLGILGSKHPIVYSIRV